MRNKKGYKKLKTKTSTGKWLKRYREKKLCRVNSGKEKHINECH